MNVRVYESFEQLPAFVLEQSSYPNQSNSLLSNNWFSVLFNTVLSKSSALRIYVVSDDADNLLAILYCHVKPGSRQLFSLTNFYSQVYAPVLFVDESKAAAVIGCLVEYIAAEKPKWASIELRYLREDLPEYALLLNSLRQNGYFVNPFRQYNNWHYAVKSETFAEYFAARSSRLKNTLKRKEKKLRRDHEVEIKVFYQADEELEQGIADYTSVYNSSWKEPEPFAEFSPSLIRSCAQLGILRLGMLYVDAQPVATQLWITTQSKAVIYKLCYDEAYKKQSVGTILSHELFRIAIDADGVTEIDYGVGDEAYKRDWMDGVRQITGLEAINGRSLAGVGKIIFIRVKNLIKTMRKE
jgi:hypothetical protein